MNKYWRDPIVGDLLLAKIGSHPFWPCMISYDPIEGKYFKYKKVKNGQVKIYHVQYFGKEVKRGWTSPGLIHPFKGEQQFYMLKERLLNDATSATARKNLSVKYSIPAAAKKAWLVAVKEAERALSYGTLQRFESFVFRYKYDFKKELNGHSSKRHGKHKSGSNKPLKKPTIPSEHDSNICSFCEKGDADFSCAGSCLRWFHNECLGLLSTPKCFTCISCELRDDYMNLCFICNYSQSSVTKCNKCDFHFHPECLKKFDCADTEKMICSYHTCSTCYKENPRNICSKGPFVRCFRCPTLFHNTDECLPVGSVRLNPSYIVCPDHYLGKDKLSLKPTSNVPYCSVCLKGGELICCEVCPSSFHIGCTEQKVTDSDFICEDCIKREFFYIGMVIWAKTGHYRWWPAQIISENDLPLNIKKMDHRDGEFPIQFFGTGEYYWIHRGRVIRYSEQHKELKAGVKNGKLDKQFELSLEEAVAAYDQYILERHMQKPNGKPVYKSIRVNRAVPPAQINVLDSGTAPACYCTSNDPVPCGKDSECINRSVLMECVSGVCRAGDRCENQKFQKRQYASVKLVKTNKCGWGLANRELIPKGDFVIEYVGEVITHQEYQKRTEQMREKNIQDYYFLYIDGRRMIDAGPMGNLARFINHSCNPNCEMQKWCVNGDIRVGIFALTDIQPGEELTFNYHSDGMQFAQKCYCGASNCQGIIGRNEVKQIVKKPKLK